MAITAASLPVVKLSAAPPVVAPSRAAAAIEPVELFVAMESGAVEVQYQPQDEKTGRVRIRNVSASPVVVRLPDTFAARPILAQFFPTSSPSTNNSSQRSSPQSVGGPFNSNRSNNSQQSNQGPNFFNQFNIAPERLVDIKVTTVCLDHGAPTPSSAMRYELVPLDTVLTDVSEIEPVLIALGKGECNQQVAQAAAWHLSPRSKSMSWDALAQKQGERTTIGRQPYFSRSELQQARKLVESSAETQRDLKRSLFSGPQSPASATARKLPKL